MIEAAVAGDAFIGVVDLIDLHEEDETDSNSDPKKSANTTFPPASLGRRGVTTSTGASSNRC